MPPLAGQKSNLSEDEGWVVDRWEKRGECFSFSSGPHFGMKTLMIIR